MKQPSKSKQIRTLNQSSQFNPQHHDVAIAAFNASTKHIPGLPSSEVQKIAKSCKKSGGV